MPENNEPVIKVTLDDIARVEGGQAASAVPATAAAGARSYGNISSAISEADPVRSEERPSLLLQGWFYLGAAGLLGAIIGWGICEPHFLDGGGGHLWGNIWLFPLVTTFMLICFAAAESMVERSWRKAVTRLLMVVPLGVVLGFIFSGMADVIYGIGLQTIFSLGVRTYRNPAWWLARAVGWAAFGVASGLTYGLVGKSAKKAKFGVMGGALGAFVGGLAFDPIALLFHGGAESRAFGLGMLGLAAGAAMGFVESALKDRWLYVSAGPLAGKQFILYKPTTVIGSDQSNDIYLFKDASIAPQHASIEVRGAQATLRAQGPVFVSGVPAHTRVLLSGDIIQVGRYWFKYNERHR